VGRRITTKSKPSMAVGPAALRTRRTQLPRRRSRSSATWRQSPSAQVALTWNSSTNATSYSVYRGTTTAAKLTALSTGSLQQLHGYGCRRWHDILLRGQGRKLRRNKRTFQRSKRHPGSCRSDRTWCNRRQAQVALAWTASPARQATASTRDEFGRRERHGDSNRVTTVSYTNTGLTDGTTYYFTVKAVNVSTSAASNEASADPVPAAPTGLGATAGQAQVALAWTASTGAASYSVYAERLRAAKAPRRSQPASLPLAIPIPDLPTHHVLLHG